MSLRYSAISCFQLRLQICDGKTVFLFTQFSAAQRLMIRFLPDTIRLFDFETRVSNTPVFLRAPDNPS